MKPFILSIGMLTASAAFSGTTSEPPRDPRIYGDHARTVYQSIMQRCGPGYSVGHYPRGEHFNPQDFCGGDNERPDIRTPVHRTVKPHRGPDNHVRSKPSVKGNNGWGNGSQDAPGSSGPRNNAENGPKGKNNGRGKNSGNSGRKE